MSKTLWAPWRMQFISKAHSKKEVPCIFCDLPPKGVNAKTLVLFRGKKVFVILNRYPYTNGHLMVVPNRHLSDYSELTSAEHVEMGRELSRAMKFLKKACRAQGFNVGLNVGRVAGAGIEGHLHYHVVPRWSGDSNFMPVLGDVRMMPEYLEETYKKLKKFY